MPAAYASADKRAELIAAARGLLHEQGFHRTTLADVADRASVPLGRMATSGEIARWIVAIADPGVTWVTGQVLGIDGGMSLSGA